MLTLKIMSTIDPLQICSKLLNFKIKHAIKKLVKSSHENLKPKHQN
jgi:hypothetical protein